jgi:hypothetical protein
MNIQATGRDRAIRGISKEMIMNESIGTNYPQKEYMGKCPLVYSLNEPKNDCLYICSLARTRLAHIFPKLSKVPQ